MLEQIIGICPNVFGPMPTFTEREQAEVDALRNLPILHKLLQFHLQNEYQLMMERNPLVMDGEALRVHHAYVAGCYALAKNLCDIPSLPE
jgi:hypothetical protein